METDSTERSLAAMPGSARFSHPTQPGWYWSRIKALTCDAVTLHRVDWCDHSKCFVIVSKFDEPLPIDRYPADQWYGPLMPPLWPNEKTVPTKGGENQHG